MRTYRLGDQISINFRLDNQLGTGILMVATVRNENNNNTVTYSTEDNTLSKINNILYNVTITPEQCKALGWGTCELELALYNNSKSFVNIGTSVLPFEILYSTVGNNILTQD